MKPKKNIIMLAAVLLFILWMPKESAMGAVTGSCGENTQYSYNTATGVLTMSGKGEIKSSPWKADYINSVKTVIVNEGITSIASTVFSGHTSLTSVKLPKSLTYIGMNAFAGCKALKSITIPKNVTDCGGFCFMNSGVTTVTFADGMKKIPSFMFEGCQSLKKINFPKTLKVIEYSAFERCKGLTSVTFPWYLEEIGFWAFKGCSNLKKVTIYQKIKKIDMAAFSDVKGLTIYGKKGTKAQAFAKSENYSFASCKIPALKGITYTKGNLKYRVVKDYINGKGTVCVTGMVKKSSSVTIPDKVKLESYNYKVTRINKNAFYKKSVLKKVTINAAGITKIGTNAFGKIYNKATIYVPKSKYKEYSKMLKKAGVKSPMKIRKK